MVCVGIFTLWLIGLVTFYVGIFCWSKYAFLQDDHQMANTKIFELQAQVNMLEALLSNAAHGHDKEWDYEELGDPNDCDQCNYDGMKEALREGRRINARHEQPKS